MTSFDSQLHHEGSAIDNDLRQVIHSLHEELKNLRAEITQLTSNASSGALLTREEAADQLRVSVRTLDDLEASGRLRAVRIGRRVLYHPDTLDAFIRQQSRNRA